MSIASLTLQTGLRATDHTGENHVGLQRIGIGHEMDDFRLRKSPAPGKHRPKPRSDVPEHRILRLGTGRLECARSVYLLLGPRLQKWPQMPAFGGRAGLSRRPAVVGKK